jgi:hypothetical protein
MGGGPTPRGPPGDLRAVNPKALGDPSGCSRQTFAHTDKLEVRSFGRFRRVAVINSHTCGRRRARTGVH